jgi:hypothetical protein
MKHYPHLPLAEVRAMQAANYMTLLMEACAGAAPRLLRPTPPLIPPTRRSYCWNII